MMMMEMMMKMEMMMMMISLASPTLSLPYIGGRGGRKGSGSSSNNDLCK